VTHPFNKTDFDVLVHQPQKLAKNVQLSRIGSRLHAFQRAIDKVRTLPVTPQRVARKVNLSFKYKFPYISVIDKASDFKCGIQLRFFRSHHQIPLEEKWSSPGLGKLPKIWDFLFIISATAAASDFKFGTQLGFAKAHHKITPGEKSWGGLGLGKLLKILGFTMIFLQRLGLATSNLVHSWGLPRPTIKPHPKEK